MCIYAYIYIYIYIYIYVCIYIYIYTCVYWLDKSSPPGGSGSPGATPGSSACWPARAPCPPHYYYYDYYY